MTAIPPMVGGLITVALNALEDSERKPPTEFKVFPYGTISTSKGTFKFTPEACDALLAEREQHSADVQIDYDHLAIESAKPGDGKAAGWCRLEKRDDGLWAVDVRWTPAAAKMLSDGEYRYFSPFFGATKDEKLIVMLMNIAITNLPAMHDIEALVAASRLSHFGLGSAPGGTVGTSRTEPLPLPAGHSEYVEVGTDIRHGSDGQWRLYSSDGKTLLGTHDTEDQAKAQESAINISKARKAGHNIPKKAKESTTMAGHKLGGYLAKHLKEKGMALKALAEKVGMPEERVRDLHDGADPTPEEMAALAKHFGLKGPEELEEQVDSFNGDNAEDDDEETPAEMRVSAGGGAGVNPSAASRRRQVRVDDDADASAMLIGLTGEENLNAAAEKLAAVIEVAASVPTMRKELDALRKKNEQADRERIIRKGKDQGKLTPALIRVLAREPVAKAEAMLEAFPVLSREQRDLRETEPSAAAVVLSAEELELCRLTREPVAKMAKFVNENGQRRDEISGDNSDAILLSYRTE